MKGSPSIREVIMTCKRKEFYLAKGHIIQVLQEKLLSKCRLLST